MYWFGAVLFREAKGHRHLILVDTMFVFFTFSVLLLFLRGSSTGFRHPTPFREAQQNSEIGGLIEKQQPRTSPAAPGALFSASTQLRADLGAPQN